MNNKNFINYHILISHSPANLNRDDMGMQKSVIFGGKRRVRISSQSLKRALRHSDYYKEHISQPSDRTRNLTLLSKKYIAALQDKYNPETIQTIIEYICPKKDNIKNQAVAAWSRAEVEKYCQLYVELKAQHSDEKEFDKEWKNVTKNNKKGLLAAFQQTVDIALSGRMATSGIMTTIDAALSVAHAITTHVVDGDIDWFTAVDDLTEEAGETGSGHLDTTEFSAGVFYRYASLNLAQLQANIGEVDRPYALEIAAHTLHLLATVVPSAKQNAFAAYNWADFALVSFSDQPISLANAFEEAVTPKNGLLAPSIQKFVAYQQNITQQYGLTADPTACFSTSDCGLPTVADFNSLKNWLKNNGE